MQNQKKFEPRSRVIGLRVPLSTYVILLQRSKDWEMSVSSVVRELILKLFDENEINTIRNYKNRRKFYDRISDSKN